MEIRFDKRIFSYCNYVSTSTTLWLHHMNFKKTPGERDRNYTRMLLAVLNKSWKQQLYGHLLPILQTSSVRWTRHAGEGKQVTFCGLLHMDWLTSKKLHPSALWRHWMSSEWRKSVLSPHLIKMRIYNTNIGGGGTCSRLDSWLGWGVSCHWTKSLANKAFELIWSSLENLVHQDFLGIYKKGK